jgi:hypothetical protein
MDIVYAAEKPSIAGVLSQYLRHRIEPQDIDVEANPDETGSFLIKWQLNRYLLSPDGNLKRKGIVKSA